MAGDTENPRVWVNADVYVGAVGSNGPTDVSTPIDNDFDALGLLSEDGMTESREEDKTDHYAWGGILVRTTRSKHKRTIRVIALEDNPVVFDLVNPGGDAETVGGVTTRTVTTPQPNPKAFVIERRDGDIISRLDVPRGEVLDVGDLESSDSALSQKELTITVYPDEDGVLYREITNDPQAAVGS